eukprot:CAMPEP_0168313700 /NCGR_PEP_ID=MMETSP0210-20121227/3762_1 /TAXON_ID=40633 /ORGANISM="Condylostoma magnum, Strain COL2" /LENGTH=32 /DNA_ID= /DNA_START= /DNA_END= /DNA_ORIENTATION=
MPFFNPMQKLKPRRKKKVKVSKIEKAEGADLE